MKKPDIVVWDEKRGWYASKLPYASDLGAPVIKADDIVGWKQSGVTKANNYFEAKFNEIKKQYEDLVQELKWTEIIYKARYNFEPIVDRIYYLYHDDNNDLFLSIISPEEWKSAETFIGAFKLDSKHKWQKID